MKSTYIHTGILAIAALAISSCKPSIDSPAPSKGTADFSRYIAVGNSLTSGFANGGLSREGQMNSFPALIAEQMKAVGGGNFTNPLFTEAQANGSGYLKLTGFSATGTPVIVQETSNLAYRPPVGGVTLYAKYTGDINNYGVPGIKLQHITIPTYGNLNGYFERLLPTDAPNNNNTTYLSFVTAKPFTFFSMWLGNNDILGYATAGGVAASPLDLPTDKATFNQLYTIALNAMTKDGAKGVVATIPDVTATAYFRTVTLASLLKAVQASPGGSAVTSLVIRTGGNVVRAATADDLFTLPFLSAGKLGITDPQNPAKGPYGLSPANPIESQYVLDKDEVAMVNDYVVSYNTIIRNAANAKGLAIMDAYSQFKEYGAGKQYNGVAVSNAFISGNLFSLDGIHLTPVGYAITANLFIDAINSKYGSTISHVDVRKYGGVKLP
jgi:hypothetical protein